MALSDDIRTLQHEIADIDRELLTSKAPKGERTLNDMRKFSKLVAGRKRRHAKLKQLEEAERQKIQALPEEGYRPRNQVQDKGWDHLYQ